MFERTRIRYHLCRAGLGSYWDDSSLVNDGLDHAVVAAKRLEAKVGKPTRLTQKVRNYSGFLWRTNN
jgi:hypothetical protein